MSGYVEAPKRRHAILPLVSTVLFVGCLDAPTARTNPLDRGASIGVTISGIPDTVKSLGEVLTVTLATDPTLPETAEITWSSEGITQVGPNQFSPVSMTYAPVPAVIRATIGPARNPRVVERRFLMRQTPVALAMTCDSDCAFTAGNIVRPLQIAVTDARGDGIRVLTGPRPIVVRDTQVVRLVETWNWESYTYTYSLRSVRAGSAWIVVSLPSHGLTDSVRAVVVQEPTIAVPDCPSYVVVGASFQLQIVGWTDWNGAPAETPASEIVWSVGGPEGPSLTSAATVTPSGLITATGPGAWRTDGFVAGRAERVATCIFDIP